MLCASDQTRASASDFAYSLCHITPGRRYGRPMEEALWMEPMEAALWMDTMVATHTSRNGKTIDLARNVLISLFHRKHWSWLLTHWNCMNKTVAILLLTKVHSTRLVSGSHMLASCVQQVTLLLPTLFIHLGNENGSRIDETNFPQCQWSIVIALTWWLFYFLATSRNQEFPRFF